MSMLARLEPIIININNLSKSYSKTKGIFDINLVFETGGVNLLIGENGSGKSTLLKCIMNLLSYQGKITKKQVKIGYAPENYIMPEYLTVHEFLLNIGRIKGIRKIALKEKCIDYFDLFQMKQYEYKPIKSLSNGTKHKVNLIQAMIHEPKILIFDEPLVSLDFESQKRLVKYLKKESKKRLVIVSTHYPEKFKSKFTKTYYIENGRING